MLPQLYPVVMGPGSRFAWPGRQRNVTRWPWHNLRYDISIFFRALAPITSMPLVPIRCVNSITAL